jgi:hypothetical protein
MVKLFSFPILLGLTFNPVCHCLATIGKARNELPTNFFDQPRRSFLGSAFLVASSLTQRPIVSVAQEDAGTAVVPVVPIPNVLGKEGGGGNRPFAPLEALLPAARLKVAVDRACSLSSTLTKSADKNVQYATLEQMNMILADIPQKLLLTDSQSSSSSSSPQPKRNRPSAGLNQQDNTLSTPDLLNAMFTRAEMERQWKILQYQESKRENGNEMRAAFNYYTSRLEFGDSYLLTASKEERKKMIRNEQLPSLATVITADLDLRDLHRNQFLTLIEDAKAEIAYQLRQQPSAAVQEKLLLDTTEVVSLMNQAQTACNEWFALIAPQDVEDAMNVVLHE